MSSLQNIKCNYFLGSPKRRLCSLFVVVKQYSNHQNVSPWNVSFTPSAPERDICVVDAGNHCLPRTSRFISVNSSLDSLLATTAKFPPIPHWNATKTTKNKWENIAGSNWEIFQRKYLGQNGANISFVTQAIKIAGGANSAKCCPCYRLSTICLLEACAPSLSTEMSRHYHRGLT